MDPDKNYADKVFHQKHLCQIAKYIKAIVIVYKICNINSNYSENLTQSNKIRNFIRAA